MHLNQRRIQYSGSFISTLDLELRLTDRNQRTKSVPQSKDMLPPIITSFTSKEGIDRISDGITAHDQRERRAVEAHGINSPSRQSTEVTLDFDAAPGSIAASVVALSPQGVSEVISLPSSATPPRHGSLRRPDELGILSSPPSPVQTPERRKSHPSEHLLGAGGRRRSMEAIKFALSEGAAAAAVQRFPPLNETQHDSSLVCSLAYRGMEVIFSSVRRKVVVGVCARTRIVLQTLELPGTHGASVVRLLANPANGMIVVAMSDGSIQAYHPVKACPRPEPKKVTSVFGGYRWINGPIISCRDIFNLSGDGKADMFAFSGDDHVDVSSSADYRLLVAHQKQMAIFDASPFVDANDHALGMELLWTTILDTPIESARISGDGYAIVVVVSGEGISNEYPFGARTFIRDTEDASAVEAAVSSVLQQPPKGLPIRRSSSDTTVGVIYKPGPFLVHTSSVSQISFRGFGYVTSKIRCMESEGNDLLLTYCSADNCVRIFSQNSWKQIMQWKSAPCTRVDWVRGISALNLGDLEPQKSRKKSTSRVSSRRPSFSSGGGGDDSAAFNASAATSRPFQSTPGNPGPFSAAGAWIAELTFRSAYPALRLSRLSYMKRGSDDSQPAHFESVAAILPAGSVIAECVLGMGDMGMSVQGIWPCWHPWSSNASDVDPTCTSGGSAMAFLGLALGPQTSHGFFGESNAGGTHSPPSELRIVASHPLTGKVVLMEFPLWGDEDFGAMELGSPLRYLLSLNDSAGVYLEDHDEQPDGDKTQLNNPKTISLEYESSILSARIEEGSKSVAITWRKQGQMSILPASHLDGKPDFKALLSPDPIIVSSGFAIAEKPSLYHDVTALPVPLSLPPLLLPKSADLSGKEKIVALKWWPDENYGGPPQLLAATALGSIFLYEMPPPWSALEPIMPSYDPFQVASHENVEESVGELSDQPFSNGSDEEGVTEREYEVMITPHPDFGIGLRLEAQHEGMPSIAGSYKKHPLSGEMLPAERSTVISLGDELLSVNGVSLEGISFDDIIATFREVGAEAKAGESLCMRFRPSFENRKRVGNMPNLLTGTENLKSGVGARETKPQLPPFNAIQDASGIQDTMYGLVSPNSNDGMAVGIGGEMQQEFSRIIAAVRDAVPPSQTEEEMDHFQNKLALLQWTQGYGAPAANELRGAALLIVAEGTCLQAKRLEVAFNCDPQQARCYDLGAIDLARRDSSDQAQALKAIEVVKTGTDNWCMSVCDSAGRVTLVFVTIEKEPITLQNVIRASTERAKLQARFRLCPMFDLGIEKGPLPKFCPFSLELVATMSTDPSAKKEIVVWSSTPTPRCVDKDGTNADEMVSLNYSASELPIELLRQNDIVDLRFIPSGSLEAFPLLAVFTKESVTAYHCSDAGASWLPTLEIKYPEIATSRSVRKKLGSSKMQVLSSPAELFSHLAHTIREICDTSDEIDNVKSDWQPDSVLSSLFTESNGARVALERNVVPLYAWLTRWVNEDESKFPSFFTETPNGIIPLREINGHVHLQVPTTATQEHHEAIDSAAILMASLSGSKVQQDPARTEKSALLYLQSLLCPSRRLSKKKNGHRTGVKSNDFNFVMGLASENEESEKVTLLPPPLRNLSVDELRLLWAMGELVTNPPNFKNLDTSAQHALICISLFRTLERAKNDEETESGLIEHIGSSMRNINDQLHGSIRMKSTFTFYTVGPAPKPSIASAACIAALTSDSQAQLIDICRPLNHKFSWESARALRLPFWVRSDDQLRKLSEEVGQKEYRETRDIMKSALFFVIVGNMRTLRNLAATDQSITGRAFLKFITSYDFASERGRRAAEKNAYSLLSKRKYIEAVSFFLLADPPMLTAAVECIVTKIVDLDLAFLVMRMLELSQKKKEEEPGFPSGLKLNAMIGGGGGGYASGSQTASSTPPDDTIPFKTWNPKLSNAARILLKERGITLAPEDRCFITLQLMWLGRPEQASHHLSGLSSDGTLTNILMPRTFDKSAIVASAPNLHGIRQQDPDPGSANKRVILKCNDIINFSSRPLLTYLMGASARSIWATTLLVGKALGNRGLELVAVRSILQNTDESDFEAESTEGSLKATKAEVASTIIATNAQISSIFDSYDVKPPPVPVSTARGSTSIFDSYDLPAQQSRANPSPSGQPQSSVFENFEYAPPKPAASRVTSSIVDSFDAPKATPLSVHVAMDQLQSSIFDSFDAPNAKSKVSAPVRPIIQSSIFDSFDVPKVKTSEIKPTSIFDSFDCPPNPNLAKNSGEASSSIFASFDGPPQNTEMLSAIRHNNPASDPIFSTITEEIEPDIGSQPIPRLWLEWRKEILASAAARRLVRELATFVSHFHGDKLDAPISIFCRHDHPLISSMASEVLRNACDGESIMANVKTLVDDMSSSCKLDRSIIVEQALRLLDCKAQPARIILCVLLHSVMGRVDLAEDVVRDEAIGQIDRCEAMALANDELVDSRQSIHHCASQYMRRLCVRTSWQLELCLWLQRGGAIPLSSLVLKETIVAVRTGFAIASWGRSHECLETLIRCEPDCELDHLNGRQLWSSMKLISGLDDRVPKKSAAAGSNSGGWEFLVDCRREEATSMLKTRPPGSFIIRPQNEDNGVFTLSFKTNLTPSSEAREGKEGVGTETADTTFDEAATEGKPPRPPTAKAVKKDDVVQHAIIRLSDAGFRCGSFGPFASLLKLLEAVSASLPFDLLFDKPPTEGIIKEEGAQPSPNGVFLRKFALATHDESVQLNGDSSHGRDVSSDDQAKETKRSDIDQLRRLGMFCQLLTLTEIRKQLSGIAAAHHVDQPDTEHPLHGSLLTPNEDGQELVGVVALQTGNDDVEERYAVAARIMRPFLSWCRVLETRAVYDIAPGIDEMHADSGNLPVTLSASETAIELAPPSSGGLIDGGDAMIRSMIQPDSGVEFKTLRVGEGGDSAMIVLFSKRDAMKWLISSGTERDMADALIRLERMEKRRVIETIALSDLSLKAFTNQSKREKEEERVCYRFVDPWEVEALESREGETMGASLGRGHYFAFSVSAVANSSEASFRKLGGLHLLGLWTNSKGGIRLTKAIASVHAPWERDAGGDLQMSQGMVTEPSPFSNSIRQHLYRNHLFRRLHMPQRFIALVQVELLDLKNLNAPSGPSLSVYALLRLKRPGSNAPLSHKARTLDSAATLPVKIGGKTSYSGPHAPASWGSLVRFRFPLPEDVDCDGVSLDGDREALFKGPPSTLQISVYEKKFMSDITLGGADVKLDALATGGQLEEWVPLRSDKHGILWFARIRLTLRFELLCLPVAGDDESAQILPPSVGLRKIQQLSKLGGAHEDNKVKKSGSTPDLLSYFESMVY